MGLRENKLQILISYRSTSVTCFSYYLKNVRNANIWSFHWGRNDYHYYTSPSVFMLKTMFVENFISFICALLIIFFFKSILMMPYNSIKIQISN